MRRIVLRSATRPGLTRRDYWLAAGAADVVTMSSFVLSTIMICLLCVGQRLDGAAVQFIVLPRARRGNGRAGVSRTAIRGCRRCCVQAYTYPRRCECW